jgi:hypothetical protein
MLNMSMAMGRRSPSRPDEIDRLSPVDRQHVQKAETNEHLIALYAY